MADALVAKGADPVSHTAGFEAFLRARGQAATSVFTADNVIDMYGVAKESYDPVPLPSLKAHCVRCVRAGGPDLEQAVEMSSEPLPVALEWGQVLVHVSAAAINPADMYSLATGGVYGGETRRPPFLAGHDGACVVLKTGPGVRGLNEGDWAVPMKPFMGTWRSMAVWPEKELLKIDRDIMPIE